MESVMWGWREVGKNYPAHKDMNSFSMFRDEIVDKINDLNNSSTHDVKYELIKITMGSAE